MSPRLPEAPACMARGRVPCDGSARRSRGGSVRLVRFLIAAFLLAGTAHAALWLGMRGALMQEAVTERRARAALEAAGLAGWADIAADGLVLRLSGAAPDGFAREMAREVVGEAAALAQIVDAMRLPPPGPPPPLALTVQRRDGHVTVTGRLPDAAARARLVRMLRAALPGHAVEALARGGAAASGDPGPAFEVAAAAVAALPEARVELAPGRVSVAGVARDADGVRAVSARLGRLAEGRVGLDLDLAAPPPVIAPFKVVLEKGPDAPLRVRACAARSAGEARRLSRLLGAEGRCRHGLGGPAGDWPGAVGAAHATLAGLPAGRLTLSYREARLVLPAGTPPGRVADVQAGLSARLPSGYRAEVRPARADARTPAAAAGEGAYWLHLTRREGAAVLAGRMPDRPGIAAMAAFAAADLGADRREMALEVASAAPPAGWRAAALLAVEALGALRSGEVALAAGRLRIVGRLDAPAEIGRLHRRLAARLPDWRVNSRLTVDLPRLVAERPIGGARCAVLLEALMARRKLGFAPGSAVIDAGSPEGLDRAAAILGRCPAARIEIGGHTDSQGSAGLNRRLSLARAEAVRDALAARGVARARLVARGYGESAPIAPNDTAEGRARNRRIAFRTLEPAS